MAIREVLIILALVAVVRASEAEDSEQKKRGAAKTTTLNAIPTGAQKPDYSYNIYSQNPSSSSPQTYQTSVSNSFYPTQGNQYYVSGNAPSDAVSTHQSHQQVSLLTPQQSPQFVPLNFIPNPGYQTKYQVVPPKSNGNIQLAIIQQPASFPSTPILQYPQTLFSPTPAHQLGPQPNHVINPAAPQSHFNFASNYQPLSLSNPYLSHPPAMVIVPQTNPYNSVLYPNPTQSFYNYYPSNAQPKYNYYGGTPSSSQDYDKAQTSVSQIAPKEDNDITPQNTEYITSADASTSYKNSYTGTRGSSYSKLK